MHVLPEAATDADLIAFIDGWAALLEAEDYAAAFAYTDHTPEMGWTPDLIRAVIKSYDDAREQQRVTVAGVPSDVAQRKRVARWAAASGDGVADIWYDLNIDGVGSDLTATFWVVRVPGGLSVQLNDIHVM